MTVVHETVLEIILEFMAYKSKFLLLTGVEGTQTTDFFENLEYVVFFKKVPLIQNKNMNVYFVYQLAILYIIFYD
jgi:hypothetical protein